MKSFARRHWTLFAVVAMLAAGVALAHAGYIDPTYLTAAPLLFPIGNLATDVPVAKLLRAAQGKRETTIKAMEALAALVPDGGNFTDEQQKAYDGHVTMLKAIDADVGRYKTLIDAQRGSVEVGKILSTKDNREDDPKRGFKNFADFALAVRAANPQVGGNVDQRLMIGAAAATTYANENAGADGGYAVPIEFAQRVAELSLDSDAFLTRCDSFPVQGNSITYLSDESTPWGTNGVRAFWAGEAQAATPTKQNTLKPNTMRLNKLLALVPVSDEMLADSPYLGAKLPKLFGRSIKWKVNDAIVNGTGAGQPLGFSKGGALVVIAKEGGQAANTLLPANIAKMYAAMPSEYLGGAEWIVAPDALPQLITMVLGNQAIWTPPSEGFKQAPGGFLLGKPVTFSQTNQAFSAQGDIYFTNFAAYETISKDGVQIAQSMHLYFDADQTAFRATFRVDGQPTMKAAITQARGAQALSPYVTLQNR